MHMYVVKAGTNSKLITQEPNKSVQFEPFVTTKHLEFSDEQVLIDFVRFKNSKKPADNVATRLAAKGYTIFCTDTINDKHLLAVHMSRVETL